MKLAETNYRNEETGCCARLDVAQWEGKSVTWTDKPFLKDHTRALLHIPLNLGAVMGRDQAMVEGAGAYPKDPLWLTDEVSPWGADIFIALDRDTLPGATVEKMSGTFLTKVFEGPYRDAGKWMHAMEAYVRGQGRTLKRMLSFYATCPKCAKHFGKNQVVLFAQVE
jgi:hypothetical protein